MTLTVHDIVFRFTASLLSPLHVQCTTCPQTKKTRITGTKKLLQLEGDMSRRF